MVNPSLHVNKAFRYQVESFMNATFGEITQPFIKSTLSNKYKCVSINIVSWDKRINP